MYLLVLKAHPYPSNLNSYVSLHTSVVHRSDLPLTVKSNWLGTPRSSSQTNPSSLTLHSLFNKPVHLMRSRSEVLQVPPSFWSLWHHRHYGLQGNLDIYSSLSRSYLRYGCHRSSLSCSLTALPLAKRR